MSAMLNLVVAGPEVAASSALHEATQLAEVLNRAGRSSDREEDERRKECPSLVGPREDFAEMHRILVYSIPAAFLVARPRFVARESKDQKKLRCQAKEAMKIARLPGILLALNLDKPKPTYSGSPVARPGLQNL